MNAMVVNGLAVIGGYVLADWALSRLMLAKMVNTANGEGSKGIEAPWASKENEGQYGSPEKELNGIMVRGFTVDGVRYWRSVSNGAVYNDAGKLVGATWAASLRPSNAPGGDLVLFVDGRVSSVNGRTLGVLIVLPGMDPTFTPAVATDRSTVKTQPGSVALAGASAAGGVARSDALYGSDLS